MAEGARLESVFTLTCNAGSNPALSATMADPVAYFMLKGVDYGISLTKVEDITMSLCTTKVHADQFPPELQIKGMPLP